MARGASLRLRGHDKERNMNQADLVGMCAERTNLTKAKMKEVLDAIGNIVCETVCADDVVTFPVIGRFSKKVSKARSCKNPRTGEMMQVPEKAKITFSPSSFIKQELQKK